MLKTLRSKVFGFLSFLLIVSLIGVGVSFWITQRVNHRITEINLRSFPFQKSLIQLGSDAEILKREMERSLGPAHWNNSLWRPKRVPEWTFSAQEATLNLLRKKGFQSQNWSDWFFRVSQMNSEIPPLAEKIYQELSENHFESASELFNQWNRLMEMFLKEITWAGHLNETETRESFQSAQDEVKELRFTLQILLVVVISVALLMIWMGERALRPIDHLRKMVKQITERGALTSEERAELPRASILNKDEVSELAREFHMMATSLIEREKMIELQKNRLEDQNKILLQMSELQKRLQEAEHLAGIGRLSAQVAHEVGNPLHSIGLEAELAIELLQEIDSSQQASSRVIHLRQSLQSITASVDRLQKITQNYLRLSKGNVQLRTVNLSEVIENALATYANSIQQSGVRIRWTYPENFKGEDKLMINADAGLLEQAIGNLIRNSLQAMEGLPAREPMIDILLSITPQSEVMIQFFDNGKGISDPDRENIFKPFFTTKATGTGLGLSFVKKVFTDLGGKFYLRDSNSEGTLFEGILPLQTIGSKKSLEGIANL
jgi:signal transduction histidine kinase